MKRIGVITDIHGNLEALTAVLALLDGLSCDEIIHLGDVVDIGPNSRECLELLLSRSDVTCLLGNHDRDFVLGETSVREYSHVPAPHKKFVFGTLTESLRQAVSRLPLSVTRICGGQKLLFCHYALAPTPFDWQVYPFMPLQLTPSVQAFDAIFDGTQADAVFFGHKHEPCQFQGRLLYVDVGSVGCHAQPVASGIVIEYDDLWWTFRRVQTPYNAERTRQGLSEMPCGDDVFAYYYLHKHN